MDLLFIFISPKGYKYSLPSQDIIFVHNKLFLYTLFDVHQCSPVFFTKYRLIFCMFNFL